MEAYQVLKEKGSPKEFDRDTANAMNRIVEDADRILVAKGYSKR